MKKIFIFIALFFLSTAIDAQSFRTITPTCDSIVTWVSDSIRQVDYIFKSINPQKAEPAHYKRPKDNKKQSVAKLNATRMDGNYDVGAIPIESSVTPTGARTYNIPIQIVPGYKLCPSISLLYNSQGGNNVAGFGWGISGLSSIEIRNRNYYYDSIYLASLYDSADAAFMLDGVPLVRSSQNISGFNYSTVRGNIQIQKHLTNSGKAAWFTALFPDGSIGTFGYEGNTQVKNSYPLTRLVDTDGNVIIFNYQYWQGSYYVSSINYGKDASIVFTYNYRSDIAPYNSFSAGAYNYFPYRLLNTIGVFDGQDEIYHYTLTHETSDDVSLLTGINCSTSENQLPPLTFSYGIDTPESSNCTGTFVEEEWDIFPRFFYKTTDTTLLFKRGKMIPGSPDESIIVLPSLSTYTKIGKKTYWFKDYFKYGSGYAPDQVILINNFHLTGPQQTMIQAESGFQMIEAIDIDADGVDELVKINNSSTTKNVTDFKITIYSSDLNGFLSEESFTFSINDGTYNRFYNNPAKCFYRFGDFRGNGKIMLLIISRDGSHFALVDLDAKTKVYETILFTMSDSESNLVFTADFENDGKTDLCHVTSSGIDVFSVSDISGAYFYLSATYLGADISSLCTEYHYTVNDIPQVVDCHMEVLDINGDGYSDIVSYPLPFKVNDILFQSSTMNISWFDGNRFHTSTKNLYTRRTDDMVVFLDVDKDHLPDMLHIRDSRLYYIPNINGTFIAQNNYANITLDSTSDLIPGDASIFGRSGDILVYSGPYMRLFRFDIDHSFNRRLIQYTNGFGTIETNTYQTITHPDGAYNTDLALSISFSQGFMRSRIPLTVLSSEQVQNNNSLFVDKSYVYSDAIQNNRGLGFCGFAKVQTTDQITHIKSTSVLDPERFGVTTEVSCKLYNASSPFSTVTYTYDNHSTPHGKLNPRLTQSVETNALTGVTTTMTVSGYDSYDYPLGVVTAVQSGNDAPQTRTSVHTWQHAVSDSLYLLGLPSREVVESDADGNDASVHLVRTDSQFDARGHVTAVQQYVGEGVPGSLPSNLVQNKLYVYDAFGNVISEKTAAYGATTFNETSFTYDSLGRYLVSSTDPMGRTTTYSGYDKFGHPASVTDHAGLTTSYTYDAWGNLTQTTLPDGTVQTTTRAWSGSSEPGLYRVTTTATGSPIREYWYDALGREVRSASQRFDGSWQYVTTEYDSRGRLSRESLPYKNASSGPSLWNNYVYDDYDRPTRYTTASGNQTRWSYSGLSTITVKDGLSSTSTTDASGNVVQVSDAGGTITYALRDDGQPSSVTVTPVTSGLSPAVTTFQYDMYGRRTAIVDPSAGTRTDAYTDNADGTSSVAHAGPNGTVTSYYDRFGRVTSVTRPEFNTSYTYNSTPDSPSFGSLLSEVSANGTLKAFTYDSLGRTASVTEHSCDSLFLTKAYTYGAGSNVAAIAYSTQDGPVTTETYHYSCGHNTKITLPDGTKVFQLTSENALGLPTAVTTGSAQRTYGYTSAGLPTSRGISRPNGETVQSLSYSYDPLTGNLNCRGDEVPGTTGPVQTSEEYSYDSLNRLYCAQMAAEFPEPDPGMVPDTTAVEAPPYFYDRIDAEYDVRGNVLTRNRISANYASLTDPYAATSAQWGDGGEWTEQYVPRMAVPMTSFDRPVSVADTLGGMTSLYAEYEYDASGRKAHSSLPDIGLERHYLGGVFERDERSWGDPDDPWGPTPGSETVQRLFLGGNAYDAPMVLAKVGDGPWTPYNIGRDTQGSITHVMTADGELLERYVYDPWGNAVQLDSFGMAVDTLAIDYPWSGSGIYSKIVGSHGYTGHEHIVGCGLINANARIYDPFLGRFLSPDPLIQDPASTQNFNRYAYCLNNPLKYTDEDGEFITWQFGMTGFSIGVNFTPLGVPLGFGFNFGNNGIGIYGEIGYRVASFGAAASCSYSFWTGSMSYSLGVYGSSGLLSANATLTYSNGSIGWGVGIGIGNGDSISGVGAYFGYSSSGFNIGISGYYDYMNAYAFSKGCKVIGIVDDAAINANDETLLKCQQEWYPDAPMESIERFTVDNVPTGIKEVLDINNGNAMTVPLSKKGSLLGRSSVYFSERAFNSARQLYTTMGHEFVHVCNYITAANMGFSLANVKSSAYLEMTEYWAYSYQSEITKSTLNSFDMSLIYSAYDTNVFSAFNYRRMAWYHTRKKF